MQRSRSDLGLRFAFASAMRGMGLAGNDVHLFARTRRRGPHRAGQRRVELVQARAHFLERSGDRSVCGL